MAVPCQRCGREYDVALFAFGRTISCACGSRVGIEPRVRGLRPASQRRFAADAMLGRLARWLRLLGFDCTYDPEISDEQIVRLALEEGRTVLTRDRRLPEQWWIEDVYLVGEERVREQLVEVIRRFDLASRVRVLTRCSECNQRLTRVDCSSISARVPPRILALHEDFSGCPDCGRVYWEGSHAARIRAVAQSLVREP